MQNKGEPNNRYDFWIFNYASLLLGSGRKRMVCRALDASSPLDVLNWISMPL